MTVQEALDKKIKFIRLKEWMAGMYVELMEGGTMAKMHFSAPEKMPEPLRTLLAGGQKTTPVSMLKMSGDKFEEFKPPVEEPKAG